MFSRAISKFFFFFPSPSYYNLGAACHGETVNDVAFCETIWKNKTLLLSGSNDCTAKLYAVEGNKMPHESCMTTPCLRSA